MLKGLEEKIKTIYIKMATNSQLPTTESKKTNKQENNKNRNRIIDMEITWRISAGRGKEGKRGKGTGVKKHKLVGTE